MQVTKNTFLWICFFLLLLAVEWVIFGLLSSGFSLTMALLVHIVVCLVTLMFLLFQVKGGYDARFVAIGLIFIATLGPFGAMMMVVLLLFHWFYSFFADPLTTLLDAIFPKIVQIRGQRVADRIVFGLDSFAEERITLPLVDIMKFGSVNQKLSAISKIMRYYTPKFIPALKMAINDSSNSVRVLAGTAIAELESKFHGEFIKLKKEVLENPKDSETLLKLANFCNHYAELSFIDKARNELMLASALKYYKMYLSIDPNNPEVKLEYARILITQKLYADAAKLLIEIFRSYSSYMKDSYNLLMELYFVEGKYEEMRSFTQNYYLELCKLMDLSDSSQYEELIFIWGITNGPEFAKA